MSKLPNIFVVGAKRTAIGAFGRALKNHTPTDLGEIAALGALQQSGFPPESVDHVLFGNALQSCKDTSYIARHIGLRIGLPNSVPAVTVNRLCGSGLETVIQAVQQIIAGDSKVVLTGGADSSSQAPFIVRNIRFGKKFGQDIEYIDSLWEGIEDLFINLRMGETANRIAEMYKITREDSDEYACQSHVKWKKANDAGHFRDEILPITLKSKKREINFHVDEHPRMTSLTDLRKLPPSFANGNVVTAGNASGIADGGASVVVAIEDAVEKHNATPLARILAWNVVGCDPSVMGTGAVEAIQNVLRKTKISLDKIGLIEINEAFASQVIAAKRQLNIEDDRLNVNGGAVAMGHPFSASSSRIVGHLVYELKRRNEKYGIAAACIGGGQAIAMLFKSV